MLERELDHYGSNIEERAIVSELQVQTSEKTLSYRVVVTGMVKVAVFSKGLTFHYLHMILNFEP